MPDTDASKLDEWRDLRERCAAIWASMTPQQTADMLQTQRESFIRAMAPCEHGDPDWETCPQCRLVREDVRPPAEPDQVDQDTLDTRIVFAASKVGPPDFITLIKNGGMDQTMQFRAARRALIAIKSREVAYWQERCELVEKTLSDVLNGRSIIARGDHRLVREDSRP